MSEGTADATAPEAQGGNGDRAFTQEQVNSFLADQKRKLQAAFADYDDLKAKATEYDQFKESSKSEQQKAIDAAKAEGAQEVAGRFTKRIVNAEIKATAAALGFSDPGDAIALFGDISEVKIEDDGPDAEAIKVRLTDIAEKKPYLLKEAKGSTPPATRPKPKRGSESTDTKQPGKSRAAAALREFSGSR